VVAGVWLGNVELGGSWVTPEAPPFNSPFVNSFRFDFRPGHLNTRRRPAAGADRGAQGDAGEHPAQEPPRRLNEHLEHPEGDVVFGMPARWGWRGLSRSG
jgi:hypothetical protein